MNELLIKLNKRTLITQGYHKNPMEFYQEKDAGQECVHVQAVLATDSTFPVLVDLTQDLHYTYCDQKLHLYIDGFDLKKTFSLSLDHYRVGYISKELKEKIIKEKYDGLAYRRIEYAPTGIFKQNKKDDD